MQPASTGPASLMQGGAPSPEALASGFAPDSADARARRRARAEIELFERHFAGWRAAIGSAIVIGIVVGWVFFQLTGDERLWVWTGMHVAVYVAQAVCCWRHERSATAPASLTVLQRRWLWIGLTTLAGLVSGSLVWFMPADNQYLLLSAAVLSGIFAIGEVVASGHRSLIYAAVTSMTSMVCLAAAMHAQVPFAIVVCLLIAAPVLYFGLQQNTHMVREIEQRLRGEELAMELSVRQQQLLRAQHEQSVLQERERIMQDMHDGLGSSLSSSLMLLERGDLAVAGAAAIMRECIDDLRLVVDSLEPTSRDVATLLGMLRYRLQRRIEAAGIALRWEMGDLPVLDWLTPSLSLDLSRLVLEAISNSLAHAHATQLQLAAYQSGDGIELVIRDDGRGFDGTSGIGRGMRTMEARARRLGGQMTIQSAPGQGTVITLRLPAILAAP